jgi:alkylation response protein AidB-like acyl-CoA dehydrogenase
VRFELSDDQALLRSSTRDFLASEYPAEKTRRLVETPRGFDAGDWGRLAEMGYLGLVLPPDAGGQGLGPIELAIVLEEMGRACLPGPYLDVTLAAALLAAAGGSEPRLAEVSAGRKLLAVAREDAPFSGERTTPAAFAGGRVRGTKFFVPFAAAMDALLVTTSAGICLVEGPFDVAPLPTLDLAQRFGEVRLDHAATLVGPASLLAEQLDPLAATSAAAMLLGLMSRCLEMTIGYVQTRQAFRRPIGSFQALQHRMADMLLRVEATRSAVYRAAWCLHTRDADAVLASAAAKAYAGDSARLVCGEALQMHGGIGFTWELDLHLYLKRAKTLEQHHGSTETQLGRALAAAGL